MRSRPPPLLAFDVSGAEQLTWNATSDEITFFAPARQGFLCSEDALHRIELFIEEGFSFKRCHLWLKLYRESDGDAPPVRIAGPLAAADLVSHGWFGFEFEPVRPSAGRRFTLVVESPDGLPGDGLRLRGSTAGPSEDTLLFRAACLRSPPLEENFHRFREAASARPFTVVHDPLMARLEISRPCDLGCVMCSRGLTPYHPVRDGAPFMSLRTFQALDPILPNLLWIIAFGLGEPLLNPEYLQILRHGRTKNPWAHVFLSTNGTHLFGEFVRTAIAENLISELQVSIDGARQATYEWIRRRARYPQVLAHLGNLVREREAQGRRELMIRTEMLVMKSNASEVFDFVRQMAEIGVDRILLDSPKGEAFRNLRIDDAEGTERLYKQVAQANDYAAQHGLLLDGPLLSELAAWHRASCRTGSAPSWGYDPCASKRTGTRRAACGVPWESVNIATDGAMRVCCNSYRELADSPLRNPRQTWAHGDGYRRLRTELVRRDFHEDCRRCLAENAVEPDRVTPPTYLDACLTREGAEPELASLLGARIDLDRLPQASDTGFVLEGVESEAETAGASWRLTGWSYRNEASAAPELYAISVDSKIASFTAPVPIKAGISKWCAQVHGCPPPKNPGPIALLRLTRAEAGWDFECLPRIHGDFLNLSGPHLGFGEGTELHGFVDAVTVGGSTVTFRGWARDARTGESASHVAVLLGNTVVRISIPWLPREDVVRLHGGDARVGFLIEAPERSVLSRSNGDLAVFAYDAQGRAASLAWGCLKPRL